MILREKHTSEKGYCIISRRLAQENVLSPQAKTLLIYMLSFPDNWEHDITSLSKAQNRTIEDISKCLAELSYRGYYHSNLSANVNGLMIPIDQVISEYPIRGN